MKECYVMNKDIPLVKFSIDKDVILGEEVLSTTPSWWVSVETFLCRRMPYMKRLHIKELFDIKGISNNEEFINISNCISFNDTLWIKDINSSLKWRDISPYTNKLDYSISRFTLSGKGIVSDGLSCEYTTDGSYAKGWFNEGDIIFLYKESNMYESCSEYLSQQIAKNICTKYIKYFLKDESICSCRLFTNEDIGFVPLAHVIDVTTFSDVLSYFKSLSLEEEFKEIMVLDYIILNVDRHTRNLGFLIDNRTFEITGVAPCFDNNKSLLYNKENLYKYKHSSDLDIKPYLCDDFDSILKECLTESIYNKVKSLKGFKFRNTEDNILPEDRLSCLNTIVNSRINRVLELGCQWLVG